MNPVCSSNTPQAAFTGGPSKDNMASVEEEVSLQDPNNHHHQADILTGLSSKSIQVHGEATGIEDLRERFTAIESKLALFGGVFGLQRLEIRSEEEDTEYDSDDSAEDLVNDALWYIREARRVRERREVARKRKKAEKRANEAHIINGRVDMAKQESAYEIVMTALQKHKPSTIAWVNWDLFVSLGRGLEQTIMMPIEAVIGEPEPEAMRQLDYAMRAPNWTAQSKPSAIRFPDNASSVNNPRQAPLPERIKILSDTLFLLISKIVDRDLTTKGDLKGVFLRPFKEFIYNEKKLREHLDELEKRFEGGDGDRKTDSSTGGSISGEHAKEGDEEEGPKGTEKPERSNDTGSGDDKDNSKRTEELVTALFHLRCLVKFIDEVIKPKIEYIGSSQCRTVLFNDLWHLFKPGDEVINQSEKQAYRVISVHVPEHEFAYPLLRWHHKTTGDKSEEEKEGRRPVTVHCVYIDFDGKRLGPVSVKFKIPLFGGAKDIKSLPIYPLRFAEDTSLRNRLIKRGKMLLDIAKFKPMYYMGFTLDTRDEVDSQVVIDFSEALADAKCKEWVPNIEPLRTDPYKKPSEWCDATCCVDSWVCEDNKVDSKLTEDFLNALIPDITSGAPSLILSPRPLEDLMPGRGNDPADKEFVIMTYRVFGFVLRSRKWAQLDLTYLKYENADARSSALNAFDRLQLPEGHREMVKSLVTQHFRDRQAAFTRDDQVDLIRGKGKGLILLLHGAPGVGKTTTAEGVAELFQKPPFQITCGDLGTTARDVEQELEKNFALASRWGCILLLDEADVFLSARERKDFTRNGLVSVFLRVLEYYAGILFLTTNRIGDFDEAFASRIHMSLHYPELDKAKTKKVFRLNIDLIQERFDRQGREIKYDASAIEDFAERHFREYPYSRWNGRQIRNACQTALALAEFDAHGGKIQGEIDNKVVVELKHKHFSIVQTAYLDFGNYLGDIRGTQGDRRAIDFGFRARSNTPYQTTPSRFSTAATTGMRDNYNQSPLSTEDSPNYNRYYPPSTGQGGQGSGTFQPLVNQGGSSGGGYRAGGSSNTGHYAHRKYESQQGQTGPGDPCNQYENSQGRGYSHAGNQQWQTGPRPYQQPNQQDQHWGDFGGGMSQGYPPPGPPQHRQGQGQNPQAQTPQGQGQTREGQSQYGYSDVQHGGGAQTHMIPGSDSVMQN